MFKSYKQRTKETQWGSDESVSMTLEQINCGALLRIADASEAMAKNHNELIETIRRQKDSIDWKNKRISNLESVIRGLRGEITKQRKRK